jgi:hypothetical protein
VGSPDPTPRRRATVIVGAFVVAAVGMAGAFFGLAGTDRAPTSVVGGDVAIPAEPGAPPGDGSTGAPTAAPSLAEPGVCGSLVSVDASGTTVIGDSGAMIVADYTLQGSLSSPIGPGPDLDVLGRRPARFAFEVVSPRSYRSVLLFARRGGVALAALDGVVDSRGYTVELVFRFDRVDGYRKIIDFRDGLSDTGLYGLDGCLSFFDEATASRRTIQAGRFVHVVLVRDAATTVTGYVDGVAQLSFPDRGGLAAFASGAALRFFGDDVETGGQESSSGAVALIRVYDGPIGADAVMAACVELLGEVCGTSSTA